MKDKFIEQLTDLFDLPLWLYKELVGGFLVHKFDMVDGEIKPTASYNMTMGQCTCPSYGNPDYPGCKHIQMAKGKFQKVECSGDEAQGHIAVFTERFMGEDFELPVIPDRVQSITVEVPSKTFEKAYSKGLRMIAGTKKLESGTLGILLKFVEPKTKRK